MERKKVIMLAHSAGAAVLAAGVLAAGGERAELERLGRVTENRGQAMPRGARIATGAEQRDRGSAKRATRKAVGDLVDAGQRTLVVAHIHPRWLRELVNEAMDLGARITADDVDAMRGLGSAERVRAEWYGYFPQRVVIAGA